MTQPCGDCGGSGSLPNMQCCPRCGGGGVDVSSTPRDQRHVGDSPYDDAVAEVVCAFDEIADWLNVKDDDASLRHEISGLVERGKKYLGVIVKTADSSFEHKAAADAIYEQFQEMLAAMRLMDEFAWTALQPDCQEAGDEMNRRLGVVRAVIAKAEGKR